jgi:ATP-dependent Clp protease protease subunit
MHNPFFSPLDEALFNRRIIQVSGGVDEELARRVNKQLLAMEAADPKKPVYLFINSPGGEVSSGFSIYDTARFIEPEVVTVVIGMAASMGSIISLATRKKENRLAFPNAKFLIHQPLISGTIRGTASEIEIHANDIVKMRQKINELYARETGKSVEVIAEATDRDNWMTPEEALKFGLIHKVVTSRSDVFQKT